MYNDQPRPKRKPKLIVILISFFILLILFGVISTICNKLFNKDYNSLSSLDQEMFAELNTLFQNETWEGYQPTPLILVKKGEILNLNSNGINLIRKGAYAVGVEGLEGKWYAKRIKMPEGYYLPEVYRLSFCTPGLIATWNPLGNFSSEHQKVNLGDSEGVFYLKYNSNNIGVSSVDNEFISFLTHEGFHYYAQKDRPTGYSGSYISTDEQFNLLKSQYQALDKAIEVLRTNGTNDELVRIMEEYVSASNQRKQENPDEFYQEMLHETLEGCAQYAEYVAYARLKNESVSIILLEYCDAIEDATGNVGFSGLLDYIKNNELDSEYTWVRYASGALLCEVLDRIGPTDWQQRLNDDVNLTLNDLIVECVSESRP